MKTSGRGRAAVAEARPGATALARTTPIPGTAREPSGAARAHGLSESPESLLKLRDARAYRACSVPHWIGAGLRATMPNRTRSNPLGTAPARWSLARNWRAHGCVIVDHTARWPSVPAPELSALLLRDRIRRRGRRRTGGCVCRGLRSTRTSRPPCHRSRSTLALVRSRRSPAFFGTVLGFTAPPRSGDHVPRLGRLHSARASSPSIRAATSRTPTINHSSRTAVLVRSRPQIASIQSRHTSVSTKRKALRPPNAALTQKRHAQLPGHSSPYLTLCRSRLETE